MKHSTVTYDDVPPPFDSARKVRGALAEEQVSASDLARVYGGAVSYWSRRLTGQLPFSAQDLYLIGLATGRHTAEFVGGQPPKGWRAPEPPDGFRCPQQDSNLQPSDYKSGFGIREAA